MCSGLSRSPNRHSNPVGVATTRFHENIVRRLLSSMVLSSNGRVHSNGMLDAALANPRLPGYSKMRHELAAGRLCSVGGGTAGHAGQTRYGARILI